MKKLIENIVDHKWSDDWLSYKFTKDRGMLFVFGEKQAEVGFRGFINKDDVIAMARHLKLTQEDL